MTKIQKLAKIELRSRKLVSKNIDVDKLETSLSRIFPGKEVKVLKIEHSLYNKGEFEIMFHGKPLKDDSSGIVMKKVEKLL